MKTALVILLLVAATLGFTPGAAAANASTCGGSIPEYASCMAAETQHTARVLECALLTGTGEALLALYEQYVGPLPPWIHHKNCIP
jgi:hypothetical protein